MMNKQGPNKISWTNWTWNPIVGCKHNCWYCYARSMYNRFGWSFEPQLHEKRLEEPLSTKIKSGNKIFVVDTGDLLGKWVPQSWIWKAIDIMYFRPDLIFQILTKNPIRYKEFLWPPNCWLGTTITGYCDLGRANILCSGKKSHIEWWSIEPAMGLPNDDLPYIDWIAVEPLHHFGLDQQLASEEFVYAWILWAEKHYIPVWVKGMSDPKNNQPQQFPNDVANKLLPLKKLRMKD